MTSIAGWRYILRRESSRLQPAPESSVRPVIVVSQKRFTVKDSFSHPFHVTLRCHVSRHLIKKRKKKGKKGKKGKKKGRKSAFHYRDQASLHAKLDTVPSLLIIPFNPRNLLVNFTSLRFIILGDNDTPYFFSRHPCIVKLNIRSNDRRNYGGLPFFNEFGPVLSRWTRELGKRPLKLHCEPPSGSKRYRRTPTIPRYTTRSRQRSSRVSIVEIRSRPRFFLLVDEQQRDFISNRGKITIEGRRSEKRKMIDRSIGEEN